MKVTVLEEQGHKWVLLGLSLSYNRPVETMPKVADRLAPKSGGHNKFLESVQVWLDITAPRLFWQQFDTYRVGVHPSEITKQSESTMHTVMKRHLEQADFEAPIYQPTLARLNSLIDAKDFDQLKIELPEGFLQRRIVNTNYKALRHMIAQRATHRLPQWQVFCEAVLSQAEKPEWLR